MEWQIVEKYLKEKELQRMLKYSIKYNSIEKDETQNQVWRKEIKSGDMIDVNLELAKTLGDSVWVQAKIKKIRFDDLLILDFIFDTWQNKTIINKWSIRIAQLGQYTSQICQQKDKFKPMINVDSCGSYWWNRSTILDICDREQSNIIVKMARIGFRIYCEQGKQKDKMGQYDGWSSSFDEWIPLYSSRIMPFLTQTMKKEIENFIESPQNLRTLDQNQSNIDKLTQFKESPLLIASYTG
ncbi:UNKNOWN [Stylonychia lemnae]|uniref:Uncharacterized protein n=1 Tax=Stylonychia lemnae TaxID=5949 RepID=A0A078A6U8_STYLE|nr:UNKNOWN [Stylonychia lemnae]|eukprot:CDW77975.1 UNKNOWN [Stylonychia lemnae]